MAKRAKNDHPSGRVVSYEDADGITRSVVVESGHLLPDSVPAKVRDDLLEQDGWSEINQSSGQSAGKGK